MKQIGTVGLPVASAKPTPDFFGNLEGTLDGLTNTLTGTWALAGGTMAMPTGISCKGT